ncbi:MAG: 3-hydroxyacyl-CoA dehydrogenase NAD-binding domain-containing protein [Bacteroidota bacterium]|nr:3-hydroxyacyl-CoA dehydrogenase NAD-binding domain-containing protein [Bacteroidota bacterium]
MTDKIIVGIAGSGAMGSGIAQVAAMAGHTVIIFDTDSKALERAKVNLNKGFEKLIEKEKIKRDDSQAILSSITYTTSVESFQSCGLVIEAVIENLEIKKLLFSDIEKKVDASCILATNTSSLPVVAVAAGCRERSRVIGIHFFNPAALMPLVEIIPAFTTDAKVTDASRNIIASWGKVTVLAKDTPGFIVNRIARPFYGEAIKMYEEGIASVATIDWAMKEFGAFKMGPFELMDFIGNDINYKVTETVWEQMFYDARYRPSLTQKRLFEAGLYGRKSGRGYYRYDADAPEVVPDKNTQQGKYIFNRVLAMLVNEAAEALYMNIATREDIDLAMTKGVNYPIGLLKWADEIGIEKVLNELNRLQTDYGDDRYRASLLLKKMHAEKRTFY